MRCPNCQTLNPPNAKFCLECGNRLVICPNCSTVNLPVAKFCIECGTSLQGQTVPMEAVTPSSTKVTVVEPVPAAPELLLPPEERRVVTVMFADITGSTPLADRLDPEDMRAILTGYFNLMTEQIRRHGGTVEKYIGDAVMAVFGSPVAHEDDPDRAIRAALDMQLALNDFNERRLQQDEQAKRLQMRIGINTGEVAVPNTTGHQRQDFLITGDAVNVAARLQQAATPDTILVGERTYLVTREVFEYRAIAPLQLRGKAEPVAAYVVLGPRKHMSLIVQHPRGLEGRQVPLVGRSLELTLMHANYARVVAERHPHLITLLGTPGIGKSRLVREFIAREQEKQKSASSIGMPTVPKILKGRCPPYGEGITYWPLIEIVRTLLQVQDNEPGEHLQERFMQFVADTLAQAKRPEHAQEIAETLLRSIGRGLSMTTTRTLREASKREYQNVAHSTHTKQSGTQVALLRAWRVLLEALAQQQPLIIVVDDLQWADEALLDLLEYLTDRITSVPILFLCPARPDFFERRKDWGGGQRNFTTIELEALSSEESSELVDELLNTRELPEGLRHIILTRSEGNPFFVEEMIRMFIDQGLLIRAEEEEEGTIHWKVNQYNELLQRELLQDEQDNTLPVNIPAPFPLQRLPDTIQGVLIARIDLLAPAEKYVLQRASIIGRTFLLSALLELAARLDMETILQSLAGLIERGFIVETQKQVRSPVAEDRTFLFKHVLIRDVVYNTIPRMRRSQEHAILATWLESMTEDPGQREDYIELLAHHYQQALVNWSNTYSISTYDPDELNGQGEATFPLSRAELRTRAIHYLTLSGDQALHSYYTLRALQAYNDAYDLLIDGDSTPLEHIQIHERLGDAHFQRGDQDDAWQEYRRALRLALNDGQPVEGIQLLDLYERQAEMATRWRGRFDQPPDLVETRDYVEAGLQLTQQKPFTREHVAFHTYQAFWYARQLENATQAQKAALAEQALSSGHEALRMAEQLNDVRTLSIALDAMGFIYNQYHHYNEDHQIQHRRQQLENLLSDRGELYDLYTSLGHTHERVDDYSSALMWFGRALNNAQTMESPSMQLHCMVGRMRVWQLWDRWDNAWQVAQEILQFIEQYQQDEKRQLWALETLAVIAYRRGDYNEGDRYARQYKRLIDQQVERSLQDEKLILATRMHAINLAREDYSIAVQDYKAKLQNSEPLPAPDVLATLAELYVITGERPENQAAMCSRALALAEESGARKSVATALRARGRMYLEQGNWKLAENDLREALGRCEVLDIPWERGKTLFFLGQLFKRRAAESAGVNRSMRIADLGRARYHFEQALGFFEALKARPYIERVRQALQQNISEPV